MYSRASSNVKVMGGVSWMALSAELERWLPSDFVFSTFTTMSPSLADSPTIIALVAIIAGAHEQRPRSCRVSRA